MRTRCLFNGQNLRIRLGLRLPNQNAKPSPRAAPLITEHNTTTRLRSPVAIRALRLRMIVEPGMNVPTMGTASRNAARNSVSYWPAPGSEDTELGVLMERE